MGSSIRVRRNAASSKQRAQCDPTDRCPTRPILPLPLERAMKLANLGGRATIVTVTGGVDVEAASNGRFGPDVQALYDDWDAFRAFVAGLDGANAEIVDET